MRGQTVTPSAPNFLIITFNAFWQIKMNHETYIRFVDAHAKSDGGNDNLHIIADESFLIFLALHIFQPCVIWANGIALHAQIGTEFINVAARETIDDA